MEDAGHLIQCRDDVGRHKVILAPSEISSFPLLLLARFDCTLKISGQIFDVELLPDMLLGPTSESNFDIQVINALCRSLAVPHASVYNDEI